MGQMRIGVVVSLKEVPEETIANVRALGLAACQVVCWREELFTPDVARRLRCAADESGVEIATIWTGIPVRSVWDFLEGPSTIGLVPPQNRAVGLRALKKGCDFACWAGVISITTHVGFIPENPTDPLYAGLVETLKEIATYCQQKGREFWFETGQETPVTLLRTIQDVGADNLGINLDPANLLLYGKANPVDALDVFGTYVRGVHAKDGEYPTNGRHLGIEKPLGEGRVNFPSLIARLKRLGFAGVLAIEREISGPQQTEDIKKAVHYLSRLLAGEPVGESCGYELP